MVSKAYHRYPLTEAEHPGPMDDSHHKQNFLYECFEDICKIS